MNPFRRRAAVSFIARSGEPLIALAQVVTFPR